MSTNVENLWTNLLYINNFLPVKEQFLSPYLVLSS